MSISFVLKNKINVHLKDTQNVKWSWLVRDKSILEISYILNGLIGAVVLRFQASIFNMKLILYIIDIDTIYLAIKKLFNHLSICSNVWKHFLLIFKYFTPLYIPLFLYLIKKTRDREKENCFRI